jgi:hypothetical protein
LSLVSLTPMLYGFVQTPTYNIPRIRYVSDMDAIHVRYVSDTSVSVLKYPVNFDRQIRSKIRFRYPQTLPDTALFDWLRLGYGGWEQHATQVVAGSTPYWILLTFEKSLKMKAGMGNQTGNDVLPA